MDRHLCMLGFQGLGHWAVIAFVKSVMYSATWASITLALLCLTLEKCIGYPSVLFCRRMVVSVTLSISSKILIFLFC